MDRPLIVISRDTPSARDQVRAVMREGTQKAREEAHKTMREVREAIGLSVDG